VDHFWLEQALDPGSFQSKWIRVATGLTLGVGVYVAGSIFLDLKESLEFIELFKRRWRRGNH
jgi:hypothetical protein